MEPITIPDYQLISKCGRGSFGDVYVARGLSGALVALKVIEKNNYSAKEFSGLKYYCSRCESSPYLINIFHSGETESFFYYTMELADNLGDDDNYIPATLANRLVDDRRLDPKVVKDLALNLLSGLETLHLSGLVHRDIKPENVIFVNNVPKLSDIGLVSSVSAALSVGGTLGFIPPEKLKSSSGSKTETDDLYALGKLIYCSLSGNSPDRFPSLPNDIVFDDEVKQLNEVTLIACSTAFPLRFHSISQFRRTLTTSAWRQRRVLNLIWFRRYLWLAGIILVLASVVLFYRSTISSYLISNYVEIPSCAVSVLNPPVVINSDKKIYDIPRGQSLISSEVLFNRNSGKSKDGIGSAIIQNIVVPSVINEDDFKKLITMQLNKSFISACTTKVELFLKNLGCQRFPDLKNEYSAYLADLDSIEKLFIKYHLNKVAEIRTTVQNCSDPENVPFALASWLSPEMWRDRKIYDLYCNCAIRSENMKVIFLEKRNKLPEAQEWDKYLLTSRIRNDLKDHSVLYKTSSGGKEADFDKVLEAYHNQLQNMSSANKHLYCQQAKHFLQTLESNVSNPEIVALENTFPPFELQLAKAKEIQSYAQKHIDDYVLVKFNISNSFYRKGYDRKSYNKLKKITRKNISNLPAVRRIDQWLNKKIKKINALREKELKNTSNHNAVVYMRAKKILTPYLKGNSKPD